MVSPVAVLIKYNNATMAYIQILGLKYTAERNKTLHTFLLALPTGHSSHIFHLFIIN